MYKLRNIVIISTAFFALAQSASAQLSGAVPDPVDFLVAPETPGPNQLVQIQVQGVGAFLGDANITWSQNGKIISQGVGLRNFSFTTGQLGVETDIHVSIRSSTQGTFTHDFVFLPSVVSLVWEADTTVPPMYRGKALYSPGSTIRVVAFPTVIARGGRVSPSALTYQWSVNDQAIASQSGVGRTVLTVAGDQLQPQEDIAVDVFFGNSKIGHGGITVPVSDPAILLYYKDPLRGILWDTALPSGVSLSGKEFTVAAAPYFFANSSYKNSSLTYTWTLNGEEVSGPDSNKGLMTLRQTGAGQGQAILTVALQNNDDDKLVQSAKTALQMIFGQASGQSLFGI